MSISKQLGINPAMDELARDNGLPHWSCVSPLNGLFWLRSDGLSIKLLNDNSPIIENLDWYDDNETKGKNWQQPTLVSFKKLALGAKFKYINTKQIYVKIGHDLIAQWDVNNIDTAWIGQSVLLFSDDDNTDIDVELCEVIYEYR